MAKIDIKQLKEALNKQQKIAIITHWSPDGDAIGSSLAMALYLKKKGHEVTTVVPNDYPVFLHWMKGNEEVIDAHQDMEGAKKAFSEAAILFCLDFNDLKRIDHLEEPAKSSEALKVLIDHHPQPDDFADFDFHNDQASSTAELVYEFIETLGDTALLDQDIAACLYTGIMTDTGSFRFPATSKRTHQIAAQLIDTGLDHSKIHNLVYDTYSEDRMKLLGYCLGEKLKVMKEHRTAYISLSKEELKRFNFKKGDTEGVVNYALAVDGICFACFFTEKDGEIKMSFRSKGSFNVNEFARTHFHGGGHKNAAGGVSHVSLEETLEQFEKLLPDYQQQLKDSY